MVRHFLLVALLLVSTCFAQIVCIDAGHGGTDPGALGNGLQEKNINLIVVKKLITLLQKSGYDARMTRSSDTNVSLPGRTNFANSIGADLFVSIHCNAFNKSANGTETFSYTKGSSKSFQLRNAVHPRLVRALGTVDRGVKTADFYVIKNTSMPAILCELAFIDHAGDAAKLRDDFYQQKCAEAIHDGILQTMATLEGADEWKGYIAPQWSTDGQALIVANPGYKKFYRLELTGHISPYQPLHDASQVICQDGAIVIEKRRITLAENTIYLAKLSPNGKHIVFETLENGIFICDATGQNIRHIAVGNNPSWSADSKFLVFDKSLDNGHEITVSNLVLVHVARPRRLIYLTTQQNFTPFQEPSGHFHDGNFHAHSEVFVAQRPTLSPDATKIAFDNNGKIFIADFYGNRIGNVRRVK